MKKIAILIILILITGTVFSDSMTEEEAAKIVKAFNGSLDIFGVPEDLYIIDYDLNFKKTRYKSSKSTQDILGITSIIIVPAGILIGLFIPELVWAPYGAQTEIPWGYIIAGVGAGIGIYDLIAIVPKTKRYKIEFLDYYNTKYADYK